MSNFSLFEKEIEQNFRCLSWSAHPPVTIRRNLIYATFTELSLLLEVISVLANTSSMQSLVKKFYCSRYCCRPHCINRCYWESLHQVYCRVMCPYYFIDSLNALMFHVLMSLTQCVITVCVGLLIHEYLCSYWRCSCVFHIKFTLAGLHGPSDKKKDFIVVAEDLPHSSYTTGHQCRASNTF